MPSMSDQKPRTAGAADAAVLHECEWLGANKGACLPPMVADARTTEAQTERWCLREAYASFSTHYQ